jgi:hypothetical protein
MAAIARLPSAEVVIEAGGFAAAGAPIANSAGRDSLIDLSTDVRQLVELNLLGLRRWFDGSASMT